MVACSRSLAFRLADLDQLAPDGRQPLIDMVFVPRLHHCFPMAADEGKYLDSFLHGRILPKASLARYLYFTPGSSIS
jgi:hypothetical protein